MTQIVEEKQLFIKEPRRLKSHEVVLMRIYGAWVVLIQTYGESEHT